MRTEQITCDRCGQPANGGHGGAREWTRRPGATTYDLCEKCDMHVEGEIRFGMDREAHRKRAGVT